MQQFITNLDPVFLAVFLSITTFIGLIFLIIALAMKKIGGKIDRTIDHTMANVPTPFKEKFQIHDPLNLNLMGNIFLAVAGVLLLPLIIYGYFKFFS